MDKIAQDRFLTACASGNYKVILSADLIYCTLPIEVVTKMVKKAKQGHKDILAHLLRKKVHVPVNEKILSKSCNNKWARISVALALRYNGKISEPKCIIKLLRLGNRALNRKLLTRELDYMGKHQSVMLFLCSSGQSDLVKIVTNITFIDPYHKSGIFLDAANGNEEILTHLLREVGRDKIERYLAVRRVI